MSGKEYKAVLFDLDGTLVSNYEAIHNCICDVFGEANIEPPSYDTVYHSVGGSILITIGKILRPSGRERLAEKLAARYLELFPKHTFDGLKKMPYADETLVALKSRGLKLACFTNKQQPAADEILSYLGLSKHLDAVCATTLHSPRKPQPEFTQIALNTLGVSAAETLGVGDSPYDYKAARAVDADSALVATGGDGADFLARECPQSVGVFVDFKALLDAVFGIAI